MKDPIADIPDERDAAAMSDDHWTYRQWENNTVEKIVAMGLAIDDANRADYLRVQIRSAIRQALRHGQSGRTEDEPVIS